MEAVVISGEHGRLVRAYQSIGTGTCCDWLRWVCLVGQPRCLVTARSGFAQRHGISLVQTARSDALCPSPKCWPIDPPNLGLTTGTINSASNRIKRASWLLLPCIG